MRPSKRPSNRNLLHGLTLMLAVSMLTGCSRQAAMAPDTSDAPSRTAPAAPPAPPSLLTTVNTDTLPGPAPRLLDWRVVTSVLVLQGSDQTVAGGRYQLDFRKSSLEKSEQVTIKTYDANVLDVQFGPHGTQFKTPVRLSISFAGTAADPGSAIADGREPVLWYLDETKNEWVEIPGTVDWATKHYVVHLEHFSRYVLGGKAGWKRPPQRETAE
ncbi:MAG: hypothetical protein ABL977_06140 [Candidatus Eisenbacteria bacterium]